MSTEKQYGGQEEHRYEGEALLLHGRITDLERESAQREKNDEEYKKAQLDISSGQLKTNRRIACFTLLLVICTAATGVVAIWQGRIARTAASAAQQAANAASNNTELTFRALKDSEKTSAITLEQMAAQSAAQETAANAAVGNLAHNRQLTRSLQRPYVWATTSWKDNPIDRFHRGPFEEYGPPGARWTTVTIQIRNSGATPAISVLVTEPQVIVDRISAALEKAKNFPLEHRPDRSLDSGFVLGPNDPQTLPMTSIDRLIYADDFSDLVRGQRAMYVVGVIEYRDIFKPIIPPYITTYCFKYKPNTLVEFEHCTFGNSIQ